MMNIRPPAAISMTSRLLGTTLCCALAVGACFADSSTPEIDADKASVSELSVAPLEHKIYPDDRPEWIVAEPVLEGERHRWPVVSLPSLTESASKEMLAMQMQIAVQAYINHLTHSSGEAGELVRFDDDYIAARLVNSRRSYSGVVTTSGGEMHEHAVELEFDQDFRDQVIQRWRRVQVGQRLAGLAGVGAGGLTLLLGLTGILKVCHRGIKRPAA